MDPLRKQSDVPTQQRVQIGLIEQAIDAYLANENVATSDNACHKDAFLRLQRLCSSGQLKVNYLPEAKRRPHHFSQPIPVTVHQDLAHGRLAFVFYKYRRYTSSWLKTQPPIKSKLFALVDYCDLRQLVLVDATGAEFTILTVEGPWRLVPHDLRMLEIYAKNKSDAAFSARPGDSPLFAVLTHLIQRGRTDSKAALDYAYIMHYLKNRLSPDHIFEGVFNDVETQLEFEEVPPVMLEGQVASHTPCLPAPSEAKETTLTLDSSVISTSRVQIPRKIF